MGKLIRKEAVFIKLETTYNTDAVPAAADAVLVEEPSWAFEGARRNERNAVKATLPPLKSVFAGTLIAVSGTVEVKGSGTAGDAPEIDAILQACGFARTDVAATSVTYNPASDGHESATVYYQEDGDYFKVTGCRGSAFSIQGETGGICKISFTLVGHLAGRVAGTVATPSFDSTVPPVLIATAFTSGAANPTISAFSLDAGLTLAMPPDMAADDGYGEMQITGRNFTGSFDPEAVTAAQQDFIGDYLANTDKAITLGPAGSTAGNQFQINLPVTQYSELSPGDRDSLRTYEISFEAREDAGDDEAEFIFT